MSSRTDGAEETYALTGRKRDASEMSTMLTFNQTINSTPRELLPTPPLEETKQDEQLGLTTSTYTTIASASASTELRLQQKQPSTFAATPVVQPLNRFVPVPEVERHVFDSWEDFHTYLQEYSEKTYQLYSVRSATPSSRRNNLVNKKRIPQTHLLIPDNFAHYVKTIMCTHGGKPRHRGTGARPNHQHRGIQCPAQINACVKRDVHGGWKVHITNQNAWHNHEISSELYKTYAEVRNAFGADVLATVNILRKAEAKRKKILEYIVDNTSRQPKMKDVHNLLSKLRRNDNQ